VRYQQASPAESSAVQPLRTQLLQQAEASAATPRDARTWERFGRWYFQASDARPVSPWSTLSLQAYVEILIRHEDRASLGYAAVLGYDHPVWMQQIIPKLSAIPVPDSDQKP